MRETPVADDDPLEDARPAIVASSDANPGIVVIFFVDRSNAMMVMVRRVYGRRAQEILKLSERVFVLFFGMTGLNWYWNDAKVNHPTPTDWIPPTGLAESNAANSAPVLVYELFE